VRALRRYWGWALLVLAIGAVVNNWFGPPAVMLLSGLCLFYFTFQAPMWCAVTNRDGTRCRENANGFLMGCHRRQHKWQKFKLTFVSKYWRDFGSMLRRDPLEGIKAITTLLGFAGGLITLAVALAKSSISA
jgi:hypothetical protein